MGNVAEFMLHMQCMKFISFCRKLRTLAQIDIIEWLLNYTYTLVRTFYEL